ncbi:Uncharacterized protein TCM_042179 [Theobroma cacao]|uniref:Uncharacterized protein n=1 Tax=Theobroma cacao TaxID=3641 RepID=A0A061GZ10_THECC|nr:Uncharacterized protein TCM_042179 [Theobroma cacao]
MVGCCPHLLYYHFCLYPTAIKQLCDNVCISIEQFGVRRLKFSLDSVDFVLSHSLELLPTVWNQITLKFLNLKMERESMLVSLPVYTCITVRDQFASGILIPDTLSLKFSKIHKQRRKLVLPRRNSTVGGSKRMALALLLIELIDKDYVARLFLLFLVNYDNLICK